MRTPYLEYDIKEVAIEKYLKPEINMLIPIPTQEEVTRMATDIISEVMQKSAQKISSVSPASQGFFTRQRKSVMKMVRDYKDQIQAAKRKYQKEIRQTAAYMRDAAIVLNYYRQIKTAATDGIEFGDILSLVPTVDSEKRNLSDAIQDEIGSYTTDMENTLVKTFSQQMYNAIPITDPFIRYRELAYNIFKATNYTSVNTPPLPPGKIFLEQDKINKFADMARRIRAEVYRLEVLENSVLTTTKDTNLGREVMTNVVRIMDEADFKDFNLASYTKMAPNGELYKPLWDKYDWLDQTKKLSELEESITPDDNKYNEIKAINTKIATYTNLYQTDILREQADAMGDAIRDMAPIIEKRTKLREVSNYVTTASNLSTSVAALLKSDSPYKEHLGNIQGYLKSASQGLEIAANFQSNVGKIQDGVRQRLKNPMILLNDLVKLTMELDKNVAEDLEIEMEYVPGITDKLFNQFNQWFSRQMDSLKEWLVEKITSLTNAVVEKMETAYQSIQTKIKVTAMSAIPGQAFGGAQMSQALNS